MEGGNQQRDPGQKSVAVSYCSRSLSAGFGDDESAHKGACTVCAGLLPHEPDRAGRGRVLQCPVRHKGSFAVLGWR